MDIKGFIFEIFITSLVSPQHYGMVSQLDALVHLEMSSNVGHPAVQLWLSILWVNASAAVFLHSVCAEIIHSVYSKERIHVLSTQFAARCQLLSTLRCSVQLLWLLKFF